MDEEAEKLRKMQSEVESDLYPTGTSQGWLFCDAERRTGSLMEADDAMVDIRFAAPFAQNPKKKPTPAPSMSETSTTLRPPRNCKNILKLAELSTASRFCATSTLDTRRDLRTLSLRIRRLLRELWC